MIKKPLVALLFIFVSACGVTSPATPSLSEKIVLKLSATPTYLPSPTLTITPTAIPPTTTPDPNFFRDDFNGILNPQWKWIREDPRNWSLTEAPGSLQINVVSGYVVGGTNSNLLLRPAPTGNFQIETLMNFRPTSNYQFAGLIIYGNDSNFIQAGRGYCKSPNCSGAGLYLDYYKNGAVVQPDFGQLYKDSSPLLIRLSRRGNNYTFDASTDGKTWFVIGSQTTDIDPMQIGLVTGQMIKGDVVSAKFDYFEVRSLP